MATSIFHGFPCFLPPLPTASEGSESFRFFFSPAGTPSARHAVRTERFWRGLPGSRPVKSFLKSWLPLVISEFGGLFFFRRTRIYLRRGQMSGEADVPPASRTIQGGTSGVDEITSAGSDQGLGGLHLSGRERLQRGPGTFSS